MEKVDTYVRRVHQDGKVQIPKEIRKAYKIEKGDSMLWIDTEKGVEVRFMSVTLQPKERI